MESPLESLLQGLSTQDKQDLLIGREKRLRAEIGQMRKQVYGTLHPVYGYLGYENMSSFSAEGIQSLGIAQALYTELVSLSDSLTETCKMQELVKNGCIQES